MSRAIELPTSGAFAAAPGQRCAVWIAVGLVVALLAGSPNFRGTAGPRESPYGGDFLQEWLGGYLWRTAGGAELYNLELAQRVQHDPSVVGFEFDRASYLPIVYPPFYYMLLAPLSLLPYRMATWLWAALMIGCGALAGLWLRGAIARGSGVFAGWARHAAWAWPAALLFAPLLENLSSGQKGTVALLVFTGVFALLQRGRPLSAGLLFAVLAFKPQLALVVGAALALKGQFRFVCGAALGCAVAAALCLAAGTSACLDYARFLAGAADYAHTAGYDLHKSHCWAGFWLLLFPGNPLASGMLTLGAAACTAALLARALWGKLDTQAPAFARQYAALVVATVLLSPHFFTYDLTILLLPLALVARELLTAPAWRGRERALAWLGGLLFAGAGLSPRVAALTGLQPTVPLLAALLATLALSPGARRDLLDDEAAAAKREPRPPEDSMLVTSRS